MDASITGMGPLITGFLLTFLIMRKKICRDFSHFFTQKACSKFSASPTLSAPALMKDKIYTK
jgi:hypothetical protein